MFVLTTRTTSIMMPAFQHNEIVSASSYLVLCIVVFIIFPLFLGVIYDEWKAE